MQTIGLNRLIVVIELLIFQIPLEVLLIELVVGGREYNLNHSIELVQTLVEGICDGMEHIADELYQEYNLSLSLM